MMMIMIMLMTKTTMVIGRDDNDTGFIQLLMFIIIVKQNS
jgi:hypothetical protein